MFSCFSASLKVVAAEMFDNDQCRIRTGLARLSSEIDRGCCIVAARSRYHFCFQLVCDLNCHTDNKQAFRFAHRHAFPGGTAWHQQLYTALDLPLNQLLEASVIDRAILLKWGHQSGRTSAHPVKSCGHNVLQKADVL
jgi:hypothetical protein